MGSEAARKDRTRALWLEGRSRFPGVQLEEGRFASHLATLERPGEDPDLYLACACAAGDAAAHRVLEEQVLSQVPLFVSRVTTSPDVTAEIRQDLRERLLVGRGDARPRIAEYAGQGPLGGWVRVAALRMALDRAGDARREEAMAEVPALATPVDPELALLRERYRDSYQTALRDALGALAVKERAVLRLSVVDGLSIDAIGRAYRVHRATAARWVVGAREQLLKHTYALLGERLQLRESELRSLATALRSELHLSLGRLL